MGTRRTRRTRRTTRTTRWISRVGGATAVGAVGLLLPLAAAGAAPDYPNGGTPDVAPNSAQQASVAGKTAERSTLPFTGTDVVELALIGGAAAGVGVVLVRRNRRTSTV